MALSSNPIWRDRNGQRVELEKGRGIVFSTEKHLPKRAVDLCETLVNLESQSLYVNRFPQVEFFSNRNHLYNYRVKTRPSTPTNNPVEKVNPLPS